MFSLELSYFVRFVHHESNRFIKVKCDWINRITYYFFHPTHFAIFNCICKHLLCIPFSSRFF